MNPETQQKLNILLDKLIEAGSSGVDVAVANLPELGREIISWTITANIFDLIWFSFCAVALGVVTKTAAKMGMKEIEGESKDLSGNPGIIVPAVVIAISACIGCLTMCGQLYINTKDLIKVLSAPKVVIVEYARSMMK